MVAVSGVSLQSPASVFKAQDGKPIVFETDSSQPIYFVIRKSDGTVTTYTFGETGATIPVDVTSGSDEIIFNGSATSYVIRAATSDAADSKSLRLTGGGAFATDGSRGAFLFLNANEFSGSGGRAGLFATGASDLQLGTVSSGFITLWANNLERWRINTSGQLVQEATNGGDLIFNKTASVIGVGTSDGSDSKYLCLSAGSTSPADGSRGAEIQLFGNEEATAGGKLVLLAGNSSTNGNIYLINAYSGGGIILRPGGNSTRWTFTSTGTLSQDATNGGDIVLNKSGSGYTYAATGANLVVGATSNAGVNFIANNLVRWTVNTSGNLDQNSTNGASILINVNNTGMVGPSGGNLAFNMGASSGTISFKTSAGNDMWAFSTSGNWSNGASAGGNIIFNKNLSGVAENIATLAAAGSTQSDATAMTRTVNYVTAADGTKGVKAPALSSFDAGQTIRIINTSTTSALKVYTNAAGETVHGQSGTTAISVAAKASLILTKVDASNWYGALLAAPF